MSVEHVTGANFSELVQSGKIALLDFWAPWCGPCRAAAPIFEEAAAENSGAVFGKVNVDEEQELAEKYAVSTIPTFVLFRDGKEAGRHVGLPTKQKLKSLIES